MIIDISFPCFFFVKLIFYFLYEQSDYSDQTSFFFDCSVFSFGLLGSQYTVCFCPFPWISQLSMHYTLSSSLFHSLLLVLPRELLYLHCFLIISRFFPCISSSFLGFRFFQEDNHRAFFGLGRLVLFRVLSVLDSLLSFCFMRLSTHLFMCLLSLLCLDLLYGLSWREQTSWSLVVCIYFWRCCHHLYLNMSVVWSRFSAGTKMHVILR